MKHYLKVFLVEFAVGMGVLALALHLYPNLFEKGNFFLLVLALVLACGLGTVGQKLFVRDGKA